MILKPTVTIQLHVQNKDKIVRTLTKLREIETEELRRFSDRGLDCITVAGIRRMLALPEEDWFPVTGAFSRTRWAERLMASSPSPVFNFNTPLITSLLKPEELDKLFDGRLIPLRTSLLSPPLPEMGFNFSVHWEIRSDFVFVPLLLKNDSDGTEMDISKLPNTWDFGVATNPVTLLCEQYSSDGSAKLIIQNEDNRALATLHFTGPVARLPPLEQMEGL